MLTDTMPPALIDLPPAPASHFSLYFYAAVLRLLEHTARTLGSRAAACSEFPFLAGYWDELDARGLHGRTGSEAEDWWHEAITAWEVGVAGHLPLRVLRHEVGLDHLAILLLLGLGLPEEDARFGALFESLQGVPGGHRPTLGLLATWWSAEDDDPGAARATVRGLQGLGLVQALNPDAPRSEWVLQPPTPIWDALRGEAPDSLGGWLAYRSIADLAALADLILPAPVRQIVETVPALLAAGEVQALIVRGPQHNGRRTLLGAMASALGRGMLEIARPAKADDRWRLVGPLATLLHALPVCVFDLGPGETAEVPALPGYGGPLGIVLGRQGGVGGPDAERAITVTLSLPDVAARHAHWLRACDSRPPADGEALAGRFRLTSGNIHRAARLAQAYAALAGRVASADADVQQACRALNRQALDTLATPVASGGNWSQLGAGPDTLRELAQLESRCRHREHLPNAVGEAFGAQLTPGVRALFSGPSGTGKTLAARLLAGVLSMDLYRIDLASVVNKYIGETEKSLNQAFARAEELDVILLLDEGDALLTQRTAVGNSNDRYANLETNYLLQRLEAFEGILIITTNAAQRIDDAFQRRMDVVITFHPPDMAERWTIWQLHLPVAHAIPDELLSEVARRCALSGGQIRNAVLHASLLALDDGGVIGPAHLEAAVVREYRKTGGVCPLRLSVSGPGAWS